MAALRKGPSNGERGRRDSWEVAEAREGGGAREWSRVNSRMPHGGWRRIRSATPDSPSLWISFISHSRAWPARTNRINPSAVVCTAKRPKSNATCVAMEFSKAAITERTRWSRQKCTSITSQLTRRQINGSELEKELFLAAKEIDQGVSYRKTEKTWNF